MALTSMVRWRTSRSRVRCSIRTACCSSFLIGTKTMCGRIVGVVLLAALNVGLDLGGCDQPHRMAQRRNPASPVVGGSTRLHAHDAGRQCLEKCFHASAAKLPAQYRSPGLVNRMDLKNVFGEIKTYDSNRHLDSLQNVALRLRPP